MNDRRLSIPLGYAAAGMAVAAALALHYTLKPPQLHKPRIARSTMPVDHVDDCCEAVGFGYLMDDYQWPAKIRRGSRSSRSRSSNCRWSSSRSSRSGISSPSEASSAGTAASLAEACFDSSSFFTRAEAKLRKLASSPTRASIDEEPSLESPAAVMPGGSVPIPSPMPALGAKTSVPEPPSEDSVYHLNSLPGGRTIESPYGRTRAYEWGPIDGRKVLFVHGISTPCIALRDIAMELSRRGCRVCVYDLWGRGYSDAPLDMSYDDRLYATQIMLVLASSPISWTGAGSGGFSMVGYSMGGGVVMSFAARFPDLINSIVLLAPGGLLRSVHRDYRNIVLRLSHLLPSSIVGANVRKLLLSDPPPADEQQQQPPSMPDRPAAPPTTNPPPTVATSTSQDSTMKEKAAAWLDCSSPALDVFHVVRWQLDNHAGYVHAFLDSLLHAPIRFQHRDWAKVGRVCTRNKEKIARGEERVGGCLTKVLGMVSTEDPIVIADDFLEDAPAELGQENIETVVFDGGHEFPIHQGLEVAERICEFWGLD